MTHLEVENLTSDYLEGLLEAGLRREFEAHLNVCPSCGEMVGDVRRAMELCHAAPELEPSPWLVKKIMLATVGERKPGWTERLTAFLRPTVQPRIAYTVAMAVFSLSIIVNAAGINLRHLTFQDLNPLTWALRVNRARHLYAARAEKFYYDLRVVIEIESRLRQLRSHSQEEQETPKQEPSPGGSTNTAPPSFPALAANQTRIVEMANTGATLRNGTVPPPLTVESARSQNP
jgi:hypothetical protein